MRTVGRLVAVAAGVVLAGAVVTLVAGGDTNTYTGCLGARGDLYAVAIGVEPAAACRDKDETVTWNITGPQGIPGDPGPAGPQGEPGPAGSIALVEVASLDFYVPCTSTGQLCAPPFTAVIETHSALLVDFTASDVWCSTGRIHFAVDGVATATSEFIGAGESTGIIDLGPVSTGPHEVALQVEGQLGGCNYGTVLAWEGTLEIVTSRIAN